MNASDAARWISPAMPAWPARPRRPAISSAAPVAPDLLAECDLATFFVLVTGAITPARAAREGRARFVGGQALFTRVFQLLNYKHAARELRVVPA